MEQQTIGDSKPWRKEYLIVVIALIIVILFGLTAMATMYHKSLKRKRSNSASFANEIANQLEDKNTPDKDIPPMQIINVDSTMCNAPLDAKGVEDASILPQWLLKRKEMIFSHMYIEQQEKLGSGQFGAVFKGRLRQGNAV